MFKKFVKSVICSSNKKAAPKSEQANTKDHSNENKYGEDGEHTSPQPASSSSLKYRIQVSNPQEDSKELSRKDLVTLPRPEIQTQKVDEEVKSSHLRSTELKMTKNIRSDSQNTDLTKSVYGGNSYSRRPTQTQIYWRESTEKTGKLSMVIVDENQINQYVEKVKQKVDRDRCDYEMRFVNKYRKGKSTVTYGISEEWIERYAKYLNGQLRDPPGPIDNQGLKSQIMKKKITEDTYSVNELLWRFLQKLYGGGPEITCTDRPDSLLTMSDIERVSDTLSNDARTMSTGIDSMRSSCKEIHKNYKYDLDDRFKPLKLANPSFFCYMNSCLQALLGITQFVKYISEQKYKEIAQKKDLEFWSAVHEVVQVGRNRDEAFTPRSIKKLCKSQFDPYEQHDAHEFLNFLLSGMQDEVNLPQPSKKIEFKDSQTAWIYYTKFNVSIIDKLFAGQFESKVTCLKCENSSTTFDPFLDLSLPIISEKTQTLDDCLATFQEEDDMTAYKCPKCKSYEKAKKRIIINKFPNMLIIQLKRFQTFPNKSKIMEHIEFPIEKWNIKTLKSPQQETHEYNLKTVISHFGPIDSGHYICFSQRGEDWFMCDDEEIARVSLKDLALGEAYVLIYEKKGAETII